MKAWLRLTLIAMTVGGGFAGFLNTFQALTQTSDGGPSNFLLAVAFFGLYIFVFVSGLMFVHDPQRTRPLMGAIAIQIPWISSPLVVYKFSAGAHAVISIGGAEKPGNFGIRLLGEGLLGVYWKVALLQDNPWRFGVNVVALGLLVLILRALRTHRYAIRTETSVA